MIRTVFYAALALAAFSLPARAQQAPAPKPPAPIQTLIDEGAQVRYLGRYENLDGWITIKSGQEQYFYVTPNGNALMMGLLFDKDGQLVTVRQVQELQQKDGGVLDSFKAKLPGQDAVAADRGTAGSPPALKPPSEQMFENVEASNWIALGRADAPVLYAFVDAQCPHCHDFMKDLRKSYIETGRVQVRIIPVGLKPETMAQAAFLLAAPDPEQRWYRYLDGDKKALPAAEGINQQGVERNMAVMQSWKLDVTPLSVYRSAADGKVKIVQGRARDLPALIADLTGRKK